MNDAVEKLTPKSAKYWEMQLDMAERREKDFRQNGEQVIDRYKAEKSNVESNRKNKQFNILYSNTETLKGALYGRTAKPDVRRRYHDADPVGKMVAEVLERALSFATDDPDCDIDEEIEAAVSDKLLPGRGLVRVVYEPIIGTTTEQYETVDENGEAVLAEQEIEFVADQRLEFRYVYWKDFRHGQARRWKDMPWIAFRHELTEDELIGMEIKPDVAKAVPKNAKPEDGDDQQKDEFARAEVWEIWCKATRSRYWYVKSYPKLIKTDDDPYGLSQFFPIPKPLLAVTTTDSLIPVPEYHEYQDQASELDRITTRLNKLVDALRRRGVYNSELSNGVLSKLANAADNQFIPVENWSQLTQTGGLVGAFQTEDLAPIIQAVQSLYEQRQVLIQTIYEVTGISDVIRGATNPNETATAQRLKGQFGSMRLQKQQGAVAKFVRDLYRIAAEIISEHYEPEVLQRMTGKQVTPEMVQLMRDDKLRGFHVDIETDSTVFEDAEVEKQSAIELTTASTQFLAQAAQLAGQVPEMTPLMFDMLLMTVRRFKGGREIEDTINQTRDQIMQKMQQQQNQPPPPDPKMEEIKQKGQLKQAEMQQDGELKRREQDMDFQLDIRKQNLDAQVKQQSQALQVINAPA